MEHIVIQAKIDDELGISEVIYRRQHRVFPEDKYVISDRWVDVRKEIKKYPGWNEFFKKHCEKLERKNGKLKFKGTLYVYMWIISVIYIAISLGLLVVIVLLPYLLR